MGKGKQNMPIYYVKKLSKHDVSHHFTARLNQHFYILIYLLSVSLTGIYRLILGENVYYRIL